MHCRDKNEAVTNDREERKWYVGVNKAKKRNEVEYKRKRNIWSLNMWNSQRERVVTECKRRWEALWDKVIENSSCLEKKPHSSTDPS